MKQLYYDMIGCWEAGASGHPQQVMKDLGFQVIHAVPQTLGNCWWFTVEDYDFELPPYIKEFSYPLNYWRDECWKDCEYFKKSFDHTTQTRHQEYCCWGGRMCLKEREKNENNKTTMS